LSISRLRTVSTMPVSSLNAGTRTDTPGVAGERMIAPSSRAVQRRRWLTSAT
jgi:hypothetical protein